MNDGHWAHSSDLDHRKSATTASPPNKHPSRMSPATPFRHKPRIQMSKRGSPGRRGRACSGSTWSLVWASRFLPWLSDSAVLRAERPGAGAAVAETGSGGGPWPPARAVRRRRAALIQ
jgi:hypothetical protein